MVYDRTWWGKDKYALTENAILETPELFSGWL